MTITERRDALTAELTALGLDVVSDPRNLTPPVVQVDMPTNIAPIGKAGYAVDFVVLVIGTRGDGDSSAWMLNTTEAIINHFAGTPLTVTSGNTEWQGQQLPCYRIQLAITTTRPTC